jgi:hypothetical protein
MMFAWSFSAKTVDEVCRLVRALGKHRYVKEVDHRLHWTIDHALADRPGFREAAARFSERRRREPELDIASRDPSLWRPASVDEIALALHAFWSPEEDTARACARLHEALEQTRLERAAHAPFSCSPEEPPHPDLVLLDWVLYPVDELDADRHAGALASMAEAGEEVDASAPLYQEGPTIAEPELVRGADNGVLRSELIVWSDEPYSYADYVFRGAAKAAKLVDPPVGYRDL